MTKDKRIMLDATMTLGLTLVISAVLIALCVLYHPNIRPASDSLAAELSELGSDSRD